MLKQRKKNLMERTIRTRRLYNLESIVGEKFNTFETEEVINNIPEDLMYDEEYIKKVKFLQLLEMDLQFYKYANLIQTLLAIPEVGERLEFIKNKKAELTEELYKYLFGGGEINLVKK